MNDIAKDLANILVSNNLGTLGADLFIDDIPADKNGLYISHTGGSLAKYTPMQESIFDIYAKYQHSAVAIDKLEKIINLLHRNYSFNLTNSFIYSILVIGYIDKVDVLDNNDKLYKITIAVINRNKLNIS